MSNAPSPTTATKPTFEEAHPQLERIARSRQHEWTYVSIIPLDEVRHILIIHLWEQWWRYDPAKGPIENWANFLITNRLKNLRRDHLLRYSRPCIGGWKSNGIRCKHYMEGGGCEYTPSKTQCNECPVYRDWQIAREGQLHIKSTVTLENHAQEVYSIPGDSTDIAGAKDWVDAQMLAELTRWEGKVYRLLYIRYLSPSAASKELIESSKKRKRPLGPNEQVSYQSILAQQRRFKAMMIDILKRGGYIS